MVRYTKHGKRIQTKAEKRRHAAKTSWAKISRLENEEQPGKQAMK